MAEPAPVDVTKLLFAWTQGDKEALVQLAPLVYHELHRLAECYFRNERSGHTLQPTALIHEAYMRLINQNRPEWQSRTHFYGVAAQIMRQVLVDYARGSRAAKRGGGVAALPLDTVVAFAPQRAADVVALDEALQALNQFDERKCRIIELRYFGGLTSEEIASTLGISVATVGRDLRTAEAWLHRELDRTNASKSVS